MDVGHAGRACPHPVRAPSYQHLLTPGQARDADDTKVISLHSVAAVKDLQGLLAWATVRWVLIQSRVEGGVGVRWGTGQG